VNYDRAVRSAKIVALVAAHATAACGSAPSQPPTTPLANAGTPAPPAHVTCYTGIHVGVDREQARIFMRRTLDPGAGTIREEAVIASNGFGFVTDLVVDFAVTGDTFRSTTSGSLGGEGRLEGPAWAWTHWTERRRSQGFDEIQVSHIEGWLEGDHLRLEGRHASDKRWSAELDAIDCADYQPRVDALEAMEKELGPRSDP